MRAGESVTDTFTYTISDGNGGTDTATATVTITGVNDAPVANNDTASTLENQSVTLSVLQNDRDPDRNTQLAIAGVNTTGLRGSVTLNADQTLTYNPGNAFLFLRAGETATETFTYTTQDEQGATSTATVTVTIRGLDAAGFAVDDTATIHEDQKITINILQNDLRTTSQLVLVSLDSTGLKGTIRRNANSSVNYDPGDAFQYLRNGETAIDRFTYTVRNSRGELSTATVTITIVGRNDKPVAVQDVVTTDEDTSITINALSNDRDNDANTVFSIANLNTQGLSGRVTLNPDNTFRYDPGTTFQTLRAGQTATDTFTYTIRDDQGNTSTARVTVTITGNNDAPIARGDSFSTQQNVPLVINSASLLANDSDIEGDALSVVGVRNAIGGTVELTPEGTVIFTPAAQFTQSASFEYLVSDNKGGIATAIASIAVTPADRPPCSGAGGRKTFVIRRGDANACRVITDFGGIGRGVSPSEATLAEVDTLKFEGEGLIAQNMLLTQENQDLIVSFEGVPDVSVRLQNFALENLDNLLRRRGGSVNLGNVLFNNEPPPQDGFDVFNAEWRFNQVLAPNTATFLNDLNNVTTGFDRANDVINGQGGDDRLSGLSGNDILRGGTGNDHLSGDDGNDILKGDEGNDRLMGGQGADQLEGGSGRDEFVFTRPTDADDTILDFEVGSDQINLREVLRSVGYQGNTPIAEGWIQFEATSEGTLILLATGSSVPPQRLVLVQGVSVDNLNNPANFIF